MNVSVEGDMLLIHVPMRFRRCAGRKEICTVAGELDSTPPQDALVSALARAFRWRELIETGQCRSITALAKHVRLDRRYVCRMLQITLLAPDLIEAILAGREPSGFSLRKLVDMDLPVLWAEQRKQLGFETNPT
jgi:hypothetical protein